MQHLPAGSVIAGGSDFGIFSTAYDAHQNGQKVILRLTAARAKSLMGGPISRTGDYPVAWQPSRRDRKKQRDWPADAGM
jgi:hypothetical protein